MLADRRDIRLLRNDVMTALFGKWIKHEELLSECPKLVKVAYSHLPPSSKAISYLVAEAAGDVVEGSEAVCEKDGYPAEFVDAVKNTIENEIATTTAVVQPCARCTRNRHSSLTTQSACKKKREEDTSKSSRDDVFLRLCSFHDHAEEDKRRDCRAKLKEWQEFMKAQAAK